MVVLVEILTGKSNQIFLVGVFPLLVLARLSLAY